MKKLVVALGLLLPFLGNAQSNEGKIIFEEKIKIDFDAKMDDEMKSMPGMEDMMKRLQEQASKSKKVLLFKGTESLYRDFDKEQDAEASYTSPDGNIEMQVMVMRPSSKVYRNTTDKRIVEQQDFMGKMFLIDENDTPLKWKMTGETAEVAGYQCQKATSKRDTSNIIVWFAPQIPVSTGPKTLGNLPGMVLKADINDGELIIEATKVDLKEVEEAIETPTKGKKVTREEFNTIADAKRKEMREMSGGKGRGMHIEIDRN